MGIKDKAGSLIEEFKSFAFKGNIVAMAIGMIIGGAFGKIVSAFVNSIVMPGIAAIMATGVAECPEGSVDCTVNSTDFIKALSVQINGVVIPYGQFLGQVIDFLIVAVVIFIVMKKFLGFMANMRKKAEAPAAPAEPPAPPEPSNEEKLLAEIRDLLKKQ